MAWEQELIDELWAECCRHGEVERILVFTSGMAAHGGSGDECKAAVRFEAFSSATACVDALDGRFFAERALRAEFDDGTHAPQLDEGCDEERQARFGYGEIAQAPTRMSIRVITY